VSGVDVEYQVSMPGIKVLMPGIKVSGVDAEYQVSMPGIKRFWVGSRRCKMQFRILITLLKNAEGSGSIPGAARRFGDEICPYDDSQWRPLLLTAD